MTCVNALLSSSDISRNDDQLSELKLYRQFLFNLAPQEWRERSAGQRPRGEMKRKPVEETAEEVTYKTISSFSSSSSSSSSSSYSFFSSTSFITPFPSLDLLHRSTTVAGDIHRARGTESLPHPEQPGDRGDIR